MADRLSLQAKVTQAKSNISNKQSQIKSARKRTDFRGVRVQDQFREGRLGIKPFRARRKIERRQGFFDLGIFNNDMVGLNSSLMIAEQDLRDFDLLGGGL